MLAEQGLLAEALQGLSNALEELSVATEELRRPNDELVATRDLVESQRVHYRTLFECAPDGCLVTDNRGTIQEANHRAADLLHVRGEFLVGTPVFVRLSMMW
jgi:two-component system, cell cycle sensor histidine kinase and response regulator CckA